VIHLRLAATEQTGTFGPGEGNTMMLQDHWPQSPLSHRLSRQAGDGSFTSLEYWLYPGEELGLSQVLVELGKMTAADSPHWEPEGPTSFRDDQTFRYRLSSKDDDCVVRAIEFSEEGYLTIPEVLEVFDDLISDSSFVRGSSPGS
jgi:hypothetical protein